MNDVLSVNVNKIESQKKRNQRIENFQQSLADVFRQFQTLLDDYIELEEKYEAAKISAKKSPVVTKNDEFKCCRCGASAAKENDVTSETGKTPASTTLTNVEKVSSDIGSVKKKIVDEGEDVNSEHSYQIFSQDFCTQGLEDSFLNPKSNPLQEIQNVTPKRSKSPIFGSKKGKSNRTASPAISSPSLSEKSVVILDYPKSKSDSQTLSVTETQDDKKVSNTPKTVKTWGFSTIQNERTDVILGSKKKLKQSKILLRNEKVTDLSTCDDGCDAKRQKNGAQTDNSCLEDSMVQVSPTQERGLSKMKQRIARRNKSAESLQKKFNRNYAEVVEKVDPVPRTDTEATIFEPPMASTQLGDSLSLSKAAEPKKSGRSYPEMIKKADCIGPTDTEVTIFEPDLASTRYGGSPSRSKAAENVRTTAEERIDDSEIIDDTLFVGNVASGKSWSQKKQSSETGSSRIKSLSLRKMPKKNNKDASSTSPDEVKEQSPPRKKLAREYYDKPAKKRAASPTYAYKRSPVRKQAEKKLLNGWSCLECQNYYEALDLSADELQKRKNACSRHRSKFEEKKCTQKVALKKTKFSMLISHPNYWNPDFSCSFQSTIWSDE